MKYVLLAVVSVVFGSLCASVVKALYEICWGGPPGIFLPGIPGGILNLTWYEGLFVLGLLLHCTSLYGSMHALKKLPLSIFLTLLVLTLSGCLVVYGLKRPMPLTRLGGVTQLPEYLIFYACVIAAMTAAGMLVGKLFRTLGLAAVRVEPVPRRKSPARVDLGFTLIELLSVIAMIAALAAVLFPVFARAKRSAYATDDIAKMHQQFLAITMYQEDDQGAAPESLIKLVPGYLPAETLTTKLDSRQGRTSPFWPANVWADSIEIDKEYALATTPIMVGFSYLKPFSHRFPPTTSFDELMANPRVGLLLDPAVGGCKGDACLYLDGPRSSGGGPAYNVNQFFVVRTDGSLARRSDPPCREGGLSYEMMFLFFSIDCKGSGT